MIREIRYALMDPAGNRTILVISPVPEYLHTTTAAKLMKLEPTAEQAGFLEYSEKKARLFP